ncbi:MerR family transcriptional regulator, partial [Streptomyces bambusae]|nr:MerR family transcriptional regulator [Streptomyces bambusae]
MQIGELAKATGASVRSLRHYEQAGLIVSDRAANGYRRYAEGAVARVRNIRRLLGAGLTLDDVQVFLPCLDGDVLAGPPGEKALRVARERLAVLEQRIAAQTDARDRLAAVHALMAKGHSKPAVQRQLGMTYRTVKALADAANPEEVFRGQWQNRPSVLDEHKP